MEFKNYIFLTTEGMTFQENSDSIEPDIENLQVMGFAKGKNSYEAFRKLIEENSYLLNTSFDEIFSYELSRDYEETKEFYYLSKLRQSNSSGHNQTSMEL